MGGLRISRKVQEKLRTRHGVNPAEIRQCFLNREGDFLEDTRENNLTYPPTQWFIAETDNRRQLKVVFINDGGTVHIKTAYPPNAVEKAIYRKYAR